MSLCNTKTYSDLFLLGDQIEFIGYRYMAICRAIILRKAQCGMLFGITAMVFLTSERFQERQGLHAYLLLVQYG